MKKKDMPKSKNIEQAAPRSTLGDNFRKFNSGGYDREVSDYGVTTRKKSDMIYNSKDFRNEVSNEFRRMTDHKDDKMTPEMEFGRRVKAVIDKLSKKEKR